jgi:hypothetical protein
VHNEDLLRTMQEAKTAELLQEKNKMDKASRVIMRCVRNYGKALRKGMGFTLRRQGASTFRSSSCLLSFFCRCFLLLASPSCCCAVDLREAPRAASSGAKAKGSAPQ